MRAGALGKQASTVQLHFTDVPVMGYFEHGMAGISAGPFISQRFQLHAQSRRPFSYMHLASLCVLQPACTMLSSWPPLEARKETK